MRPGTLVAEEFFVRIIDGKVDAFGEKGDFDGTKNPAIDVTVKPGEADQ